MAKKILIVDDEPDVLNLTSLRLTKLGYEVYMAKNGEIALHVLLVTKPDLILLDIKLPKLNGYDVCRKIKANPELAMIPIIFATADASVRIAQQSKLLGVQDYLMKPFDGDELMEKISKYL